MTSNKSSTNYDHCLPDHIGERKERKRKTKKDELTAQEPSINKRERDVGGERRNSIERSEYGVFG